ncbi:YagK/YfjJ domain-containing protein, partial [Yersinia enterocolitica]
AHLAKNSYMIKRSDDKELKKFVYRISYLAKDRGKYSEGDKTKRFDGSRLFGKLTPTNIEKH